MNISTSNKIQNVIPPTEFSSLAPVRDSNSVHALWKKVKQCIDTTNKISDNQNQIAREFKKIDGKRNVTDLDLFPFKIYVVPSYFRPPDWDSGSFNWRIARVRAGLVLTSVVSTGSYVIGTDLEQDYAYSNLLPASTGNYDIEVPINTPQYWFWIEQSGSASSNILSGSSPYYLRASANPQTPDNIHNPNGWTGWPYSNNNTSGSSGSAYIPIGYCDTNTSGSQNIMYVRQFLNGDVLSEGGSGTSGGFNFKGIYDFNAGYDINDVVEIPYNQSYYNQVSSSIPIGTTAPPSIFIVTTGSTLPTAVGTYICVNTVPKSGSLLRNYTYNCYYPFYPPIPQQYKVNASSSLSGSVTVANNTFWTNLGVPNIPMNICINQVQGTWYVSAVLSGSAFNPNFLPWQGS